MQVAVGIRWTIIVHNDVDSLHIDTTAEDIRRDQNTFLERLECRVTSDTSASN
jgi:hypothetical protein